MSNNIIIREYQKNDRKDIENIIREAWNYDQLASPKVAEKLAAIFLASCLTNQTFVRVADLDGKAVGIIMGKDNHNHSCPFSLKVNQFKAILSLLFSTEGRKTWKIFGRVNEIDSMLREESAKDYDGEVAFFAVNSEIRGKGLGKRLFSSFIDYAKSTNFKNFFLFTDTSCSYQFYDSIGLIRKCQKNHTFTVNGQKAPMSFYLYEGLTDNF